MEVLIITGMSGAGKTSALNLCQDNDYYSLDNLPPKLIKDVIMLMQNSNMDKHKLAIVTDTRGGEFFKDLSEEIKLLKEEGIKVKLLFIDCADETLIKRYKELRRPHPQGKGLTIEQAIFLERKELETIKDKSDYYIDTTNINLARLKSRIEKIVGKSSIFSLQFISFGFKNGIVKEADYVFDVRFSENPFYIPKLKPLTGLDKEVRDFVLSKDEVKVFIDKVTDLIDFVIPSFDAQGKSSLVIAIGCTGGKHRSTAISEKLYSIYKLKETDKKVEIFHRDKNLW